MKLCTFQVPGSAGTRAGAATPSGIVDLHAAGALILTKQDEINSRLPPELLALLQTGDLAVAREAVAAALAARTKQNGSSPSLIYASDSIKLLTPIPHPPSLRDFFAFEDHVKKGFEKRGEPMPQEWYEIPVYYKSGTHNLIGDGQDVRWPAFTQKFDYELELAAVIGRKGSNIPAALAREYIAGFMVMNDFSARDIQRQEMKVRLGPSKGKDWCTSLGPVLVTTDEIGDPYDLKMTARVNGETWSEGNSRAMHWKFEQMIEFLSWDDTIYPGDIIGSGTVGGGCGLELDRWIKPGDVMELEIEKIGILRNRVVKL
jgi:2-keto-4-pentenoate hydratase/2-oxohepta-3-ene-1,7-dioic acid hydratase in catechol pathway